MRLIYLIILSLVAVGVTMALTRSELSFVAVMVISTVAFLAVLGLADRLRPRAVSQPAVPSAPDGQTLPAGFGQALLERMPVPLVVLSSRGIVTFANRAAQDIAPQIEIGEHISSAVRAPGFVDALGSVLDGEGAQQVAFEMARSERFFEALLAPLDADALPGEDWTVIMRIEDRTQARQNAHARTDFVANASHELRTPLASLLGYIETLRGHARDDPEAQERFLGIMDKQAKRMKRLVDDLMSLSKIELEAHMLPQSVVDMIDVFSETAAALGPLAEKSNTQIVDNLPDQEVLVRGDRDQMLQVAVNLIDNAIKYGGKNGVVTISAEILPDKTGVSVTDTGQGIDRANVARLTERFYRVNTALSREVGGTGLGLAIVKHILNRHQGTLDVTSEPGKGSKFTVWLPTRDDSVDKSN